MARYVKKLLSNYLIFMPIISMICGKQEFYKFT